MDVAELYRTQRLALVRLAILFVDDLASPEAGHRGARLGVFRSLVQESPVLPAMPTAPSGNSPRQPADEALPAPGSGEGVAPTSR